MDQDTPMSNSGFGNSGFGTSSGSDTGSTTGRSGATGSMGNTGLTSSGSETCASCGQPIGQNHGLEQFLGRLGINEEMINNIKSSMQNVDVEEYLNTARDYLKSGSGKATNYAKENPGKVAAGVAVLAVGAGLLISAMNKD
jgi:hypothetical protein